MEIEKQNDWKKFDVFEGLLKVFFIISEIDSGKCSIEAIQEVIVPEAQQKELCGLSESLKSIEKWKKSIPEVIRALETTSISKKNYEKQLQEAQKRLQEGPQSDRLKCKQAHSELALIHLRYGNLAECLNNIKKGRSFIEYRMSNHDLYSVSKHFFLLKQEWFQINDLPAKTDEDLSQLSKMELAHLTKSLIISAISCFQRQDFSQFLELLEKVNLRNALQIREYSSPTSLAQFTLISLILTQKKVVPFSDVLIE